MNTAVILCARKERDYDVPYPLVPFYKDLCLLKRIVKILRELNYTRILIVAGYKHELFESYEGDGISII